MADLTCDICNQSVTTSAQCNHIRIAFEYVKVCIICGGAVEFDAVSFGYGAPLTNYYPLPDGRWLLTSITANDAEMVKVISSVMGGNPLGLSVECPADSV